MRPKIVVATPWPVWPLINGRRTKAFARCVGWSQIADVEIVSAGASPADEGTFTLGTRIVERRVAFAANYGRLERTPFTLSGERSAFFPMHAQSNSQYASILATALESATLGIACTPFVYRSLRGAFAGKVLLDVQAVEAGAWSDIYADDPIGREIRELTATIECEAWLAAEAIVTPSGLNHEIIIAAGRTSGALFGADASLFRSTDVFPARAERAALKARSNFAGSALVVFAGSMSRGNLRSLETMLRLALRLPQVRFLILGSIVEAAAGKALLPNVGFTGFVDDAQFTAALSFADLCIEFASASALGSSKLESYIRCGAPIIADRTIGLQSGLSEESYRPATERSVLEVVAESLSAMDDALLRAERAFRQRYDAALARRDAAVLEAVFQLA